MLCCSGLTGRREGAAGAFLSSPALLLYCGGWNTTDVAASRPRAGFIKGDFTVVCLIYLHLAYHCHGTAGEYLASCEQVEAGGSWDQAGPAMVKHRAFHSMAATSGAVFAFGGYNDYQAIFSWHNRPIYLTSHLCRACWSTSSSSTR